jgi:hypothetical protein
MKPTGVAVAKAAILKMLQSSEPLESIDGAFSRQTFYALGALLVKSLSLLK